MMQFPGWRFAVVVSLASLTLFACSSDSVDPTITTVAATTSTTATGSTTTVATGGNVEVGIVTPAALSTHIASIDLGDGRLAAPVRLTADVTTPAGETVRVAWSSDLDGPLGEGLTLEAQLSNDGSDVVTHTITAMATASGGGSGSATVAVVVRVPSN